MLALRDQENLVHGRQTAAASKALNQGTKLVNPKTPGNKAPKTPFKIPLNDENDRNILGGGKPLKGVGKGSENLQSGGKKSVVAERNAFVTPMGPRSRAPLGQKTTNAKAKGAQGLGPNALDNEVGKTAQKSATSRKPKARISHAEAVKVDVLADNHLEEREIEYMPPRVKDLPDVPDDLPELNLSMFKGDFTKDCFRDYLTRPGEDGLSIVERQEKDTKERYERMDARTEAMIMRDVENAPAICIHIPECCGEHCKDEPERRRQLEAKYDKILASLAEPSSSGPNATIPRPRATKATGPSATISKAAASTLGLPVSVPGPRPIQRQPKPAKFPSALVVGRKKPTPPPANPSPMRHAAAVRASNTTIGYSKGRSASATIRQTVLPPRMVHRSTSSTSRDQHQPTAAKKPEFPDTTLAPAIYMQLYGAPPVGSDMWAKCKLYGCFDEEGLEDDWSRAAAREDLLSADAEEDFELVL